ncbi:hypothetical protein BT69DRAFT_1289852 [Atractiella rhizophila]|nr:hypothetical protein BT69DRAFT_1289852 [Atractiella rhizophila]
MSTSSQSPPVSPPLNGVARMSLDSGRASPRASLDGTGAGGSGSNGDRERLLRDELAKVKEERDNFENQYRGLLGKLTNMRNTLGDKLKQDADELDRRAAQITSLTSEIETLNSTVSSLQSELLLTTTDTSTLSSDLTLLRSRLSTAEGIQIELQDRLENERRLKEEWEEEAMREKVRREDVERRAVLAEEERERAKAEERRLREELEREKAAAEDLARVLEEFQAGKEREMENLVGDVKSQLDAAVKGLAEYKKRASVAEARLSAVHTDSEKSMALAKELKEKNVMIGKLRHDAAIMNEHLTEAMRRLKRDSTENNVDRRLVTNVLITFLRTPRADTKRYEMLQLLSSVLSWTDEERERAGLQKAVGGEGTRPNTSTGRVQMQRKGSGKEEEADNESFSNLFVEFLLREAGQAAPSSASKSTPAPTPTLFSPTASTPGSPRSSILALSPPPPSQKFKLPEIPPFNPDRLRKGQNIR